MLKFIVRRLLSGVVLLFVVSAMAFTLLYFSGGDIARKILGQTATQETVAEKARSLGIDRPLLVQYWDWLTHAVRGDLGYSWFGGELVAAAVTSRVTVTLSIVISATLVIAVVSVGLGVWAAIRRGWVDRLVQVISVLGFAIPAFLVALALVLVFAINLGWFKPTGYVPFSISVTGWLSTVTLPIAALAIGGVAAITQQVRGSMVDALRQDYVRTLRSGGLSTNRVMFKHVLRNAAGPALAVLAISFIALLSGVVVIERMFAIPGIGQAAVTATSQGDIPLVMGIVIITVIIVLIANILIDLAQAWLNPKVRLT